MIDLKFFFQELKENQDHRSVLCRFFSFIFHSWCFVTFQIRNQNSTRLKNLKLSSRQAAKKTIVCDFLASCDLSVHFSHLTASVAVNCVHLVFCTHQMDNKYNLEVYLVHLVFLLVVFSLLLLIQLQLISLLKLLFFRVRKVLADILVSR